MAMTKKEKEYVENLEKELSIRAALMWTPLVKKDLSPPLPGGKWGEETSGWVYNAYNCGVDMAWSSSVYHGTGYPSYKLSGHATQNAISMFSTKLLALQGLRNAVERESAQKLLNIDKKIEAELEKINNTIEESK